MTEIEKLAALLKISWSEMTGECDDIDGFKFISEESNGSGRWMEHISVITRGPSGQHYRWDYESGLTEYQESEGPAEYGEPEITKVEPVVRTIEVTEWVES